MTIKARTADGTLEVLGRPISPKVLKALNWPEDLPIPVIHEAVIRLDFRDPNSNLTTDPNCYVVSDPVSGLRLTSGLGYGLGYARRIDAQRAIERKAAEPEWLDCYRNGLARWRRDNP